MMCYRHLLANAGCPAVHEPNFKLDSVGAACGEVAAFKRAGGDVRGKQR
jgi:hypothetical protein